MTETFLSPERCAAIRARLENAYQLHEDAQMFQDIEDLLAAYDQITLERDEAVNDARMGHARLNECSDGAETQGQPLYDRISAKIQKLVELATEREHIIKAIGAEKEAVQAQADAARHRQLAAEYRAQRIVCDDELRRRAEKAEAALVVLTQERDELQERCRAISYVSHDQGDKLAVVTQRAGALEFALREVAETDPHYAMVDQMIERAAQRLQALAGDEGSTT